MNILQLSKHMNDSGVNSHIIELSRLLKSRRHRVIVASSGGAHAKKLEEMGIEHRYISFNTKNPFVMLKNLFALITLIRKEKIDIAHTHWRSIGVYLKLASIFTGVNFVWTNHSNHIPSSLLYRIFTFYGKCALTVSNDMVPMLHKRLGIPLEKIRVVFNGIDSTKYIKYTEAKKQQIRDYYNVGNKKVICLISRLTPVKGHLFLLDALNEMTKTINKMQWKVLFAGNGSDDYKNEIIKKAKKYDLLDNIVFTGYINPVDILNIADVMVLPSKNEGFGIVCIEAFAMRVPVIRSKTGGYSDMKDYCIGIDYGDTKALCTALVEVLSHDYKTTEMVNNAFSFYKNKLTSEKMVEELLRIYQE